MTTLRDALKAALSAKRAKDMYGCNAPSREEDDTEIAVSIKYVRCRECHGSMPYDDYLSLHSGQPVFCQCPPGEEDLITFVLDIEGPLEPEL